MKVYRTMPQQAKSV